MKTPIAAGHTAIVKILLDAGANPNAAMKDGMSASQLAEKMHRPEALELLKSRSAIRKQD
jgi:ankyrin repeat protein